MTYATSLPTRHIPRYLSLGILFALLSGLLGQGFAQPGTYTLQIGPYVLTCYNGESPFRCVERHFGPIPNPGSTGGGCSGCIQPPPEPVASAFSQLERTPPVTKVNTVLQIGESDATPIQVTPLSLALPHEPLIISAERINLHRESLAKPIAIAPLQLQVQPKPLVIEKPLMIETSPIKKPSE